MTPQQLNSDARRYIHQCFLKLISNWCQLEFLTSQLTLASPASSILLQTHITGL